MRGRGRPAALPPSGWRPPQRRDGLRVAFTSDDGRQRRTFDFTAVPGHPHVREELVAAFVEATGPLGGWRRLDSASGLATTIRSISPWLADNRPGMTSLAQLSVADLRMLLNGTRQPNGDIRIARIRGLLRYCPVITDEIAHELAKPRDRPNPTARQPYTEQEWRWISIALRGVIRRARTRIHAHRQLVEDFRAGRLDERERLDPERCLALMLDHVVRTGERPPSLTGILAEARTAGSVVGQGRSVRELLHLTAGEAWAFGALLVALTGLNPSTVFELRVPRLRATAPTEPGIVFVDAVKHRRGPHAAMTVPLAALPTELHPAGTDRRPQGVLDTSLTTPFGVFMTLLDLTETARQLAGGEFAFTYYNGVAKTAGSITDGAPSIFAKRRTIWLREVLSGQPERDAVVLGTGLDRLRKTHLERHRRPVAHTPAMLARYLRNMDTVTEESFQIVREALDEQVTDALERRRMTVEKTTGEPRSTEQDTVLGTCVDFDHSSRDDGNRCRQTFLTCLDCANARAFPRHLPFQLAVLDEIRTHREQISVQRWVAEFAGRAAQLEQVIDEFEPAQRAHARTQITDHHRRLAARLLAGDLDPL